MTFRPPSLHFGLLKSASLLCALLAASCAVDTQTQAVLLIDASELGVDVAEVRLFMIGVNSDGADEIVDEIVVFQDREWPIQHVVAPASGDADRTFEARIVISTADERAYDQTIRGGYIDGLAVEYPVTFIDPNCPPCCESATGACMTTCSAGNTCVEVQFTPPVEPVPEE